MPAIAEERMKTGKGKNRRLRRSTRNERVFVVVIENLLRPKKSLE